MEALTVAEIIFLCMIALLILSFSFLMITFGIQQIREIIADIKLSNEIRKKK